MEYKEIKFIVGINACDFTAELLKECALFGIETYHQGGTIYIDWSDPTDMPESQKWLLETYGPEIKQYEEFSVVRS